MLFLGAGRVRAANVQRFRPAPDNRGLVRTEGTAPLEHKELNLGLTLNYAYRPVELGGEHPVESLVTADFLAAYGVWDRLYLALDLPVHIYRQGIDRLDFEKKSDASLGDLRFAVKYAVAPDGPVGVAASLLLDLPTGSTEKMTGGDGVSFGGRVAVDKSLGAYYLAGNLGFAIRKKELLNNVELGSELNYSLGLSRIIGRSRADVLVELSGAAGLAGGLSKSNVPFEIAAALRWLFGAKFYLYGGAGFSPFQGGGVGSPAARIFCGLQYTTNDHFSDKDLDGVMDRFDLCPAEKEDPDEFEDEDGCPEADNDEDGFPDEKDACPNEPEDMDGFEDKDGCPETDNDGDGVPDDKDKCPITPEDLDGFRDEDGCPDPDNDKDGYPDDDDECPLEAEDFDKFHDFDGCPEPDNDEDGVLDEADKCPLVKEDPDGFEDDDGCPELGGEPPPEAAGPDNRNAAMVEELQNEIESLKKKLEEDRDEVSAIKEQATEASGDDAEKAGILDERAKALEENNKKLREEIEDLRETLDLFGKWKKNPCALLSLDNYERDGVLISPEWALCARVEVITPHEPKPSGDSLALTGKRDPDKIYQFPVNGYMPTPIMKLALDKVHAILLREHGFGITIEDYADPRGSAAHNKELSEKRANRTRDYLLSKEPRIDPSRIEAVGYGEDRLIDNGTTEAAYARNRSILFRMDLMSGSGERSPEDYSDKLDGDSFFDRIRKAGSGRDAPAPSDVPSTGEEPSSSEEGYEEEDEYEEDDYEEYEEDGEIDGEYEEEEGGYEEEAPEPEKESPPSIESPATESPAAPAEEGNPVETEQTPGETKIPSAPAEEETGEAEAP